MLTSQLSTKHRDEITARGLDLALCQRYGVRSSGEAIAFDYLVNGKIHNTKNRLGKGNMPWAKTGVPLVLWNVDALRGDPQERELIITEGEFDALACIQAGFLDAVSVPNGAPTSAQEDGEARFKYLFKGEKLHPDIDKFNRIILAVDGDEKGLFLRDALAVRLGEARCLWIDWPDGCKDANDVLRHHGPEHLAEVLMNPRRMFIDEVCTLDDIPDPPEERAYHLGFVGLENHLKFPKKGFVTILGPYGSGKSTLVRQIAYNMQSIHGWKTGITCFEESAKWRTVNAFRKMIIGKPRAYWAGSEVEMADNWIRRNIVFFQKKKRELMTGARYLDRIEYAVKVYGLNMVITDPMNELDHQWPNGKSKTDYMADLIMAMKDLADSYSFLKVCCTHPPSMSMRVQNNKKKKIFTLADNADTAHFGNKSDIGLAVWQGNGSGYTLVNIDKIKNRELYGEPTGVELKFLKEQEKYIVSRTGWDVLFDNEEAIDNEDR
jgi:twinkle protein